MIAAKSLVAGVLVVAALALISSGPEALGGSIVAGGSGTLYIGGSGNVGAVASYAPAPVPAAVPATAPAPAASVAAGSSWSPGSMNWASNGLPIASATPVVAGGMTTASLSAGVPQAPAPVASYDAFINFGNAPYAEQGLLAPGTAQPWFTSSAVTTALGHTATMADLNGFAQTVLARVESTFANSGLNVNLTTDPSAHADHMISVASGLSSTTNPDAVGVTDVGRNGFDFIDKLGYATSLDQLEWAVAHNVAHEMMHAFGGSHHTTPEGTNLDAPSSPWSVMIDPNTKFSAASVAEMTYNLRQGGLQSKYGIGAEGVDVDGQELSGQPVPEPATLALWAALAGAAGMIRYRRPSRSRPAA